MMNFYERLMISGCLWLNVLAVDGWLDSVMRKRERRVVTSREEADGRARRLY